MEVDPHIRQGATCVPQKLFATFHSVPHLPSYPLHFL